MIPSEIWVAIGGIIASVTTWILGRKKSNAETSILESNNLEHIRQFYENVLNDITKRLEHYIAMSEENRIELHRLKQVVTKLIDDACLAKGCTKRVYYQMAEIEEMLAVKKSPGAISITTEDSK